jgi:hypothetical protein
MPIVRRSRKYRAIIGRRCEAYAPLTSGYIGLVGGSNSSRAHHAVRPSRRFPKDLRIAPNWRGCGGSFCLCNGGSVVGRLMPITAWLAYPI